MNPDAQMLVSWHAVTRFCQRILDVRAINGIADCYLEAKAHCAALKLSVPQVQAMILDEGVLAAIRLGRDRVATGLFTAVINEGRVVTVFQGGEYWKPKGKMRKLTRLEARRRAHQAARRRR